MAESVQPLVQPPIEDIRNAAQIAQSWADSNALADSPYGYAFASVARLLRHAMEQLGEPSFACVQATALLLREARNELPGVADEPRYARDTAAVILNAAVTGEIPKTWSEP